MKQGCVCQPTTWKWKIANEKAICSKERGHLGERKYTEFYLEWLEFVYVYFYFFLFFGICACSFKCLVYSVCVKQLV